VSFSLAELQRRSYEQASDGLRASWPERQALDEGGIAALLDRNRYGVLATSRPDGRAHAAPVAFTVLDGAFWIGTVRGLRLRNLESTPWASLVVIEGRPDEGEDGEPHKALTAEGPVTLHTLESAWPALEEPWITRHGHAADWAAAMIELRPERVFSHDAAS
jgi:hypothetical protein